MAPSSPRLPALADIRASSLGAPSLAELQREKEGLDLARDDDELEIDDQDYGPDGWVSAARAYLKPVCLRATAVADRTIGNL